MRKILSFLLLAVLALSAVAQQRAKYVFYFIGDGMGVNQVNGTETFLGALEGRIGISPLLFPSFPASALVNTQSATNGVTDSAAGGTALATGHKTKNGALGLTADLSTSVSSVAAWAQQANAAVGVATSVTVDHATPAAFYAHVPSRKMYYPIGRQLIDAGYDFYAGSDFTTPTDTAHTAEGSLYQQAAKAGYTIARGYKDFRKKQGKAQKLILLQTEEASAKYRYALPYAIDRRPADMTLQDVTRAAISHLTRQAKDGFFLMVEGGKIDWACHANDVATAFRELQDMDNAIRVAYEFYEQHPDETLIVVTADHETGGIVLGTGPYELRTDLLRYQRMSVEAYSAHLAELRKKAAGKYSWELVKADLTENFGFWREVELSDKQTERLRKAYESIEKGLAKDEESLYSHEDALANTAKKVMAECARISWASGGHSNGYVPVFAVGVGAETFNGRIDNTEIPFKIADAAGWKAE